MYGRLTLTVSLAGQMTPPGDVRRRPSLSAPIIGDDDRLVACSGKNLHAFEPNGSAAWTVPLGHQCNQGIPPVTEEGKVQINHLRYMKSLYLVISVFRITVLLATAQVYLVAEDKVIEVTPYNINSARPASRVFFSYNATVGRSEEIIGLAISGRHWSLFVTIRNIGLFVLSLRDGFQWSLGPVLDRRGYRTGCKRNVADCYFDSPPVVDQCEGALYVSLHSIVPIQ